MPHVIPTRSLFQLDTQPHPYIYVPCTYLVRKQKQHHILNPTFEGLQAYN